MIRIVPSSNRRAVAAILSAERVRDAATERKVAAIVGNFRGGATRRLDASLGRMRRELTLEWH